MNRLITILAFFLCTVSVSAQPSASKLCQKGDDYFFGLNGVAKNPSTAVEYYREAAEKGYGKAQFQLGQCYLIGQGVDKVDSLKAFDWILKSAKQNFAEGQYRIGLFYYEGIIVPSNKVEAVTWFLKAAEQGHDDAQNYLGICYLYGYGVTKKDVTEALKWFRKAAKKNNRFAQCNLGDYYYGQGGEKNVDEALAWYRKSADNNYYYAQYKLGKDYYWNYNYNEAVIWFNKAAEQGHDESQYYLGLCYRQELGVNRNFTEAVKWFRKAAEQGNEKAQKELEELEKYPNSQTSAKVANTTVKNSSAPITPRTSSAISQKRLALVVGNSDYPDGRLANPVNDARDISAKLKSLGFDVMEGTTNLNHNKMIMAIADFCEKASRYDVALFFYAGHAVQYQGINYMIPSGVSSSSKFIPQLNVSFEEDLMKELDKSGVKVKIAVLDACRNRPARVDNTKRGYGDNGLSAIGFSSAAAPRGTFLVFSTQSGEEADDGKDAKHSPFTSVLLEEIDKPGVPIFTMFDKVRRLVDEKTNHKQSPFIIPNMFGEEFFFKP